MDKRFPVWAAIRMMTCTGVASAKEVGEMLDGLGGVAAIITASAGALAILGNEFRKHVDWRDGRRERQRGSTTTSPTAGAITR